MLANSEEMSKDILVSVYMGIVEVPSIPECDILYLGTHP